MKTIEIVCLANSRKVSGRCIAGKSINDMSWLRPVSEREHEEISELDRRYENGHMPKLLDIISIPIKKTNPTLFQTENCIINDEVYWVKKGVFTGNLVNLLDTPENLWGLQHSSYQGRNDRVPEQIAKRYTSSLAFIKPESFEIIVREEGAEFNNAKRKVRANFAYNGEDYLLPITDPEVEKEYLGKNNGCYSDEANNLYICVSLGYPYNGFCYKLIASVIKEETT